jgi:hypothetical protein
MPSKPFPAHLSRSDPKLCSSDIKLVLHLPHLVASSSPTQHLHQLLSFLRPAHDGSSDALELLRARLIVALEREDDLDVTSGFLDVAEEEVSGGMGGEDGWGSAGREGEELVVDVVGLLERGSLL